MRKLPSAFKSCVESGVLDDMTEAFPFSTCGTKWVGKSDMASMSSGSVSREQSKGNNNNNMNVLRGFLQKGFLQMTIDLANTGQPVDATRFAGVELQVLTNGPEDACPFHVDLKTNNGPRPYRASFALQRGEWHTVRLPWSQFLATSSSGTTDNSLKDASQLQRIGIIATGNDRKVHLALSNLRFYK
eukprot:CAMPEP_0116836212 /NCGR_PEP_ID=MMETSP0418-20121206/7970_1 /TAXON_ID=1158023 /ORGANISM="Astrosyne radiata, Strain 13vi08-1A" /LENGTH=186 /DNA_ID=CAMNT_0004465955 /DNA_START=415 /DNA_END=975 /DNA_ORIENTATION=+